MGSILNKITTFDTVIYPEAITNETVVVNTPRESVVDIIESPKTEEPIERNEYHLIKKLEQDGYDKLKNIDQTLPSNATTQDIGDALINIIKSGADEFKEKTGRNMTYAEMRAAWG